MRYILVLILLAFPLLAQDLFQVSAPRVLVSPTAKIGSFMNPKWSPDNSRIAFTSTQYKGIWIYHLERDSLWQLTDELSAGFGFSWSDDASSIVARVSRYDGSSRLSAIKLFDIDPQTTQYLTEYKRRLSGVPKWNRNNSRVYFHDGRRLNLLNTGKLLRGAPSLPICYARGDKIILENTDTGDRTVFQPFKKALYLNVTLSPDGQKIAFEVYGGNAYIMDVDSRQLVNLGRGNNPSWSPNGRFLAFTVIQDDGHRFTAADIYVITTDGSQRQNITSHIDAITIHPTWSADGNKMAYSTYEKGTIEVIQLMKP